LLSLLQFSLLSSSSTLHPLAAHSANLHRNYTAISDFRLLNRRTFFSCPTNRNFFINIDVISKSNSLLNEEFVNVTVGGITNPSKDHWIAMITPSNANVEDCSVSSILYGQTGDLTLLPLLCHYPVKAAYLSSDPDYLPCKKKGCVVPPVGDKCEEPTCIATLSFHIINFRTDVEFFLFDGGFLTPCLLYKSKTLSFQNPNAPLYGHLSSIDSTATSPSEINLPVFLLSFLQQWRTPKNLNSKLAFLQKLLPKTKILGKYPWSLDERAFFAKL
ncbi:hypothetical protein Csa_008180, partial [Cucumis sativus]